MFVYIQNGKANIEHTAEKVSAKINAVILIITPNIQNNSFIRIKNFKPSKLKLKIIPGNFIDHDATDVNTSDTPVAEKIQ